MLIREQREDDQSPVWERPRSSLRSLSGAEALDREVDLLIERAEAGYQHPCPTRQAAAAERIRCAASWLPQEQQEAIKRILSRAPESGPGSPEDHGVRGQGSESRLRARSLHALAHQLREGGKTSAEVEPLPPGARQWLLSTPRARSTDTKGKEQLMQLFWGSLWWEPVSQEGLKSITAVLSYKLPKRDGLPLGTGRNIISIVEETD